MWRPAIPLNNQLKISPRDGRRTDDVYRCARGPKQHIRDAAQDGALERRDPLGHAPLLREGQFRQGGEPPLATSSEPTGPRGTAPLSRSSLFCGIASILGASASFALMNLGAKVIGTTLSPLAAVFIRSSASFLIMVPVALCAGLPLVGKRPSLLVARGIVGSLALICSFISLEHLQAADATLLNQTSALFVMLLAPLCLGERVTKSMLCATAVGFVGVALVVKPWMTVLCTPALIGLAGGFLAAVVMILLRGMRASYPAPVIVLHFSAWGMLLSFVGGAFRTPFPALTLHDIRWIAVVGLCGTLGQLLLTLAYRYTPASIVAPLALTSVIFAGAFEWVFFGSIPDRLSLIGAILLIVSVSVIPSLSKVMGTRPERRDSV